MIPPMLVVKLNLEYDRQGLVLQVAVVFCIASRPKTNVLMSLMHINATFALITLFFGVGHVNGPSR